MTPQIGVITPNQSRAINAGRRLGLKSWEGVVNYEAFSMLDDVDAVGGMMRSGKIVAIKGIGGFRGL